jgi:hypothetical protein
MAAKRTTFALNKVSPDEKRVVTDEPAVMGLPCYEGTVTQRLDGSKHWDGNRVGNVNSMTAAKRWWLTGDPKHLS